MDTRPAFPGDAVKIWITPDFHGNRVLEFADSGAVDRNQPTYVHTLGTFPYFGTGHVVFGGFLYYHWGGEDRIVRYDLHLKIVNVTRQLPDVVYSGTKYVFSRANTRVDFSADENGLWAVYATHGSDKVRLVRLEPETLLVMKGWELADITVGTYGNGFLACGVLYLIRSMDHPRTQIDYAYDVYTESSDNPWLLFNNPYGHNSMVTYNPRSRLIFGWDSGKLISYPMLM